MIKRTLEISREAAHLCVRHEQLVLKRGDEKVDQIPCEDIGVVLVDHPQVTYTHGALSKLAEFDAAVVICGRDHLPVAMLVPMADHAQVVWRVGEQLSVRRPLCKQLWRQIIVAKVRAQAANLPRSVPARRKLVALARAVRSGDLANIEAQAARIYWANWLSTDKLEDLDRERFRRDPDGCGINAFLNFGYAVVRAAIARAIVAAGLIPSLGIHHRNRSNAFCLADDLIEPLRPLVDDRVRELYRQGYEELNQPAKAALLELLAEPVSLGEETGPLMVQLHRYVASLVKCYRGEAKRLAIPQAMPVAESEGPELVSDDGG